MVKSYVIASFGLAMRNGESPWPRILISRPWKCSDVTFGCEYGSHVPVAVMTV